MKLLIVGAGAWGTALAVQAASRHEVTLWARDASLVQALQQQRVNTRYLPSVVLPPTLRLSHASFSDALTGVDLTVLATPMASLRAVLFYLSALSKQVPQCLQ